MPTDPPADPPPEPSGLGAIYADGPRRSTAPFGPNEENIISTLIDLAACILTLEGVVNEIAVTTMNLTAQDKIMPRLNRLSETVNGMMRSLRQTAQVDE